MSRLTADTTQVKAAFGSSVSVALRNVALFVGAIVLMIWTSPKLSALVLLAIPFIVLPLVASGRGVRRRSRLAQDKLADGGGLRGRGDRRDPDHAGVRHGARDARSASPPPRRRRSRPPGSRRAPGRCSPARRSSSSRRASSACSGTGRRTCSAGTMTAGRLSQFVLYAVFAASALGQLSEVYGELAQAAGSAERLAEILATKPAIVAPPDAQAPAGAAARHGRVRRRALRLPDPHRDLGPPGPQLPGRAGRAGGAGRPVRRRQEHGAPAAAALLRSAGRNRPRRRRAGAATWFRSACGGGMALVPQEPAIFAASVADNIRYGRRRARDADVVRAAELASADAFIRALPQGYDTMVGERGVDAVRRPAPAHRHRPRHPQGRPDPAARRGHLGAGRRERARGAGRARPSHARPHHPGHRPPARDRAGRRPHPGHGRRPHRRGGHARDAARPRRPLRPARAAAVRGGRGSGARRRSSRLSAP